MDYYKQFLSSKTDPAAEAEALAPIEGISLEEYSVLAAKMKDCGGDLEICARIAEENGLPRPRWDAVMNGWNARMADPKYSTIVTTKYMDLYYKALESTGPKATATFEEYCQRMAYLNKFGDTAMWEHFGISAIEWGQISYDWTSKIVGDQQMTEQYKTLLKEEEDKLG